MGSFNVDSEKYVAVVREAIKELGSIMDFSIKDWAKDLVKSAMGRSVRTKDPIFWPSGMLVLGLVEARRALLEKLSGDEESQNLVSEIDAVIMKHLNLWKHKYGFKVEFIDDALTGAALVKLYQQSYDEAIRSYCKEAADKIYEYLKAAPRDEKGTIVYNAEKSSNVFADGVGQVSLFLSAYGKTFEVEEAEELARLQIENYMEYGMDEKTFLPYHGYCLTESKAEKKGVLSWGRAAGWLIMGVSECASLPGTNDDNDDWDEDDRVRDPRQDKMDEWYFKLSEALLEYQKSDGGYGWQVQAMEGPVDTSATGMILYGLLNGGKCDGEEIHGSLQALERNIEDGKVKNALSACDDFGVHYQTYGHYPWGQGAALAALSVSIYK